LADYGVIFQNASQDTLQPVNPPALDAARDALIKKIDSTIAAGSRYDAVVRKTVGPYQGWLEGANVSLIMASGLMLSVHGKLTRDLDSAIRRVIGSYVFNRDAGCGLSDGRWRFQNNCMDDYAVAASGLAWIAAYKYKRGDADGPLYANAAKNSIALALSLEESVCAYNNEKPWLPPREPCNARVSDMSMGQAEVVSLNHGQQSIAYGLGLMTSISSAFIGLQTANEAPAPALTNDQRVVALALFKEGQSRTAAGGDTFATEGCYTLNSDHTTSRAQRYTAGRASAISPRCSQSALHKYSITGA